MAARKPARHPATKTNAQVELIQRAFYDADPQIVIGVARPEGREDTFDYLCQEGVILVRNEDVERVVATLGIRLREKLPNPVSGLTLLPIGEVPGGTADALSRIDDALGVGVATPNHVISIAPPPPPVTSCPATEPEVVNGDAGPDPGICPDDRDGAGVLVYVADTGLVDQAAQDHAWLEGVTGTPDPLIGNTPPYRIPPYTGHGTFIAGVLRCMAPAAEVFVERAFKWAGATLELDLAKQLDEALSLGADVISLSAGATSRLGLSLLGFEPFWRRYRDLKNVILVAAAGNNGARTPLFFPAASPHVTSVGALAANWRSRASFSNFGSWVDVYAPGEGLINAFATGEFECNEPPHVGEIREFEGMARWSGTSFATPLVAGLIAARMSRTGENGREAAKALVARAQRQTIRGVGAVMLPCLDDHQDHGPAGKVCRRCQLCSQC